MLQDRRIVLAVCGGIAAYKSAYLASLLKKKGADVRVVMTKNACEFISPLTFETLTKNAVITDTFDRHRPFEVSHIAINKFAELIIVAPATANIIAKAACGIADDFVSTMLLASTCPVLFAPAMNTAMYENPATQRNISFLRSTGSLFLNTVSGLLACGDTGAGRMAEPEEIAEYVESYLRFPKDYSGRKVLVTAGPTVEAIDDVRFLTNRSSGKMGYAIAHAAKARGAEVTLVSGPCYIPCPAGVQVKNVKSASDMKKAVLESFDDSDIIIKAAAVADYTPKCKLEGKLKKGGDLLLELVRTDDILAKLGKIKGDKKLIGFAAEAVDIMKNATEKLNNKNVDIICANDISRSDAGFGSDENAITMLFRDGRSVQIEKCSKEDAANAILDAILTLY